MDNIPELPLEPPEDTRRVYADCVLCGDTVREYDDCYEINNIGCCCTKCIEAAHRIEVTLD